MLKRVFDILIALTVLLLLSPLLVLIGVVIYLRLGSPIFFRQSRPGIDAKSFKMIKFRTMTNERGEDGSLLPNEERMTSFGKFLRSTSLDEFPELLNVLRGDMSLVGPRPLLMEYIPYYSEEQHKRHEVKPGITGWAQVNGRNAIGWDKKLALDVWYVRNQSFWLDIKILLMTFLKVFKREGISYKGHATMPRFDEYVKQQNSDL